MSATKKSAHAELDARLEKLRGYKMSPDEVRAQRRSMVMGLRATDSPLTHERVDEFLTAHGM